MSKENLKLPSEILEPNIIIHCMNNISFFLKVKQYLQTNKKGKSYFNDEKYQIIFNILSKWYDKKAKFPNKTVMHILIEKLYKENKELRILLDAIITKIYTSDPEEIEPQFIEEETQNFIIENNVYEAMLMSQIDVQQGNFGTIVERMRDAITVNFDVDLGVSIRDIDTCMEKINELAEEYSISTGFPSLDEILDGGWRGKELYVFAGIPGIGKTALLGVFAIKAFLQGKNVLVYTFETSDRRLLSRYYANLFNMTKKEILLEQDEAKQKMEKLLKENVGDIIIKDYPANIASANTLLAHINDLRLYKQWKPDIIIADYLLIQSTNDKYMGSDNSYKYYKTVSEEDRNIAKLLDIPFITAAQINREGQDDRGGSKAVTTSKQMSESRGIFDTCDVFITINQPSRDRELNIIRLYADKIRNGGKGDMITLNVNYPHMRIFE